MKRENIHTSNEVEPTALQQNNRLPLRSLATAALLAQVLSQDISVEHFDIEQPLNISEHNHRITPSDYQECSAGSSGNTSLNQGSNEVQLGSMPELAFFSAQGKESQILLPHDLPPSTQEDLFNEIHQARGYKLHLNQSVYDDLSQDGADSLQHGPADSREEGQEFLNFTFAIEHLHQILYEYPEDLLETLGIQSVIVSSEPEYAGRYYRSAAQSVGLSDSEFEGAAIEISLHTIIHNSRFDFYNDVNALRRVVAHEIAHAIHNQYCYPGSSYNDPTFSDGVPFLNDEPNQVDLTLTDESAGHRRQYAREYGADNVVEHFATIIDYTLGERGIIQPEDSDYGSPLQLAQEQALVRAELVYPGFMNFAEQVSQLIDDHDLPVYNERLDEVASSDQLRCSYLIQTLLDGQTSCN